MNQLMKISLFAIVLVCIPLGAATVPTVIVTNRSDSLIQITPIDEAHRPPAPLDQIRASLPPGAFILSNRRSVPINAVVVLWSYIDQNGSVEQKRFNCDGYIVVPTSAIVRANDSALLSPGGCIMREYFSHVAAGKPMLGGDLYVSTNKSISEIMATLTAVRITVDSVIFADGKIWGPDARQYYKTVSTTHWAIRSVVEEVSLAKAAGQPIHAPLRKILSETGGRGDQPSSLRRQYASTIHDSPNPEGTLEQFSHQAPLPEFQHIGGENQ